MFSLQEVRTEFLQGAMRREVLPRSPWVRTASRTSTTTCPISTRCRWTVSESGRCSLMVCTMLVNWCVYTSVWETICGALPHSSYQNFRFKIPWVPHLSISGMRNVGLEYPPPLENKSLVRTWHLGFELVWSTPLPDLSRSWYVDTNRCILQGYRLVIFIETRPSGKGQSFSGSLKTTLTNTFTHISLHFFWAKNKTPKPTIIV